LVARLEQAERAGREKLFDSYVEKARALRHSQYLGQRFECLDTIRKAVRLAGELAETTARLHTLRNEAAAATALLDLRPVHQWVGATHHHGIAFDPLLERYARADRTGAISVRRVADDAELLRLPGPAGKEGPYPCFSPDGVHLSVWQEHGGKIKVWRLGPTASVLVWDGPASGQGMPTFTPDGRSLAYPLPDGSVELVDLGTGNQERLPSVDGARGFAFAMPIAVHPDGRCLAVATRIGTQSVVQVRARDTGRVLCTLRGARRELAHPLWHPSGRLLAVTDATNVRLWDTATEAWAAEIYASHTGGIRLAFSHAGDLLAGTDWNGETRFWEPHSGLLVFKADTRLAGVQFSPDDRFLAGPVWDDITHVLRIWEVARPCYHRLRSLPVGEGIGEGICAGLAVSPGDELLASAVRNGVALWDLRSLQRMAFLPRMGQGPCDLAFDAAGSLWTFGGGGLWHWPIRKTGRSQATIGPPTQLSVGPRGDPGTVSVAHQGQIVALRDRTGSWAIHVGPPERRLRLAATPEEEGLPAVSPDGRVIAFWNISGQKMRVLDAESGALLRELPLDRLMDQPLFSPDGRWLWELNDKQQVHLWRTATWERSSAVAPATQVAFSPDSRALAVETGAGSIRLLDPDTRTELVVLEDPNQDRTYGGMTFSHDSTRLITISYRATQAIHVWDLRQLRQELATMGLDWEQGPYPPTPHATEALKLSVVDRGRLSLSTEKPD
jgi:WD40 repeat protein